MDSLILCGMQFGDEGKGTFVDYLAHEKNIDCMIRYNGGSQASHTVVTPSMITHKFSQLGSGMFLEKCHTYLTENMVINLHNLLVEMEIFSNKTGISISDLKNRIHIHENCFVVTPYHKLINKLRELSKGDQRRGTVGTGVSEVKYLLSEPKCFPYEPHLGLQVKDIYDSYSMNPMIGRLKALYDYVLEFYQNNKKVIWQNVPKDMKENLIKEISFLLEPKAFLIVASDYVEKFRQAPKDINLNKCIYNAYELSLRKNCLSAIFEGSQGLLIDATYGIRPNTTFLDTTNHFAFDISYYKDNITNIGIAKAFNSRHGLVIFPTESSFLSTQITDENQVETFWNGRFRFGWFDALLLRYAQKINQVDELYLSSLDKLDDIETIKVCNEYLYKGIIDERFDKLFTYFTSPDGKIIITDIKESGDDLGFYLERCLPIYLYTDGWKSDISNISEKSQLPNECLNYILLLEKLLKLPITLVSVGPTRNNKIRM